MADTKVRSLRALDALNFCNAGIQTGLGPFIAIFYASERHWNPGQIGFALACQSIAIILIQPFVGSWIDASRFKRGITAAAAGIAATSAACIAIIPQYGMQVAVQLIIGLAATAFPPAIAAFALGMVSKEDISKRVARNESFAHFGNFLFAMVAACVGTFISLQAIFYAAAMFAAGMALAALAIDQKQINHAAARSSEESSSGAANIGYADLFKNKRVMLFLGCVTLFFCANAATLPLVGQILTQGKQGRSSAWEISAAVVVAEGVMIGVAWASGRGADRWGRKPLFVLAFAALAIRNGLTVVSHNKFYLIGLQGFDGVAAAIFGVMLTLISADLARGTGRFNFLRATAQSATALGGFTSNTLFGYIAKRMGFNASFWGLAAVAVAGGMLYQTAMSETRPEEAAQSVEQNAGKQAAAS